MAQAMAAVADTHEAACAQMRREADERLSAAEECLAAARDDAKAAAERAVEAEERVAALEAQLEDAKAGELAAKIEAVRGLLAQALRSVLRRKLWYGWACWTEQRRAWRLRRVVGGALRCAADHLGHRQLARAWLVWLRAWRTHRIRWANLRGCAARLHIRMLARGLAMWRTAWEARRASLRVVGGGVAWRRRFTQAHGLARWVKARQRMCSQGDLIRRAAQQCARMLRSRAKRFAWGVWTAFAEDGAHARAAVEAAYHGACRARMSRWWARWLGVCSARQRWRAVERQAMRRAAATPCTARLSRGWSSWHGGWKHARAVRVMRRAGHRLMHLALGRGMLGWKACWLQRRALEQAAMGLARRRAFLHNLSVVGGALRSWASWARAEIKRSMTRTHRRALALAERKVHVAEGAAEATRAEGQMMKAALLLALRDADSQLYVAELYADAQLARAVSAQARLDAREDVATPVPKLSVSTPSPSEAPRPSTTKFDKRFRDGGALAHLAEGKTSPTQTTVRPRQVQTAPTTPGKRS